MATSIITDELWHTIQPLLPRQRRSHKSKGGRPPIGDREVLTGIVFVLKTGIAWEDLPQELGCGCGVTCFRRLRLWQKTGVWRQVQALLEERLKPSKPINWKRLRTERAALRDNWMPSYPSFEPHNSTLANSPKSWSSEGQCSL